MKKFLLMLMFASTLAFAKAQDYKKVETDVLIKQPEAAKTELDKVMANPKAETNPETWYFKAYIYSDFYADPVLSAKYPHSEMVADTALQKYISLDTGFEVVKKYRPDPFFNLYSTSFNQGIRTFNEKKWDSSAHYFGLAADYSSYIFKNKWTTSTAAFDTTSFQYAGYANQNNQQPAEAIKYYKILADYKVNSKEFEDMYKFMLDYYSKNKDEANFKKYLAESKELYPSDISIWNAFDIQDMMQNYSLDQIVAKYDKDAAAGNLTEDQYIGYAQAFAGVTDRDDFDKLDSAKQMDLKYKAADVYKKAFALGNSGLYAYNIGVLYYNVYSTLDDRYFNLRGTDPKLKPLRQDVEKQEFVAADSALAWLNQAYTLLKAKTDRDKNESNSLNKSVDFLANIYAWKRDKSRGTSPADVDKYDALFKQFDAEHDKYRVD